MPKVGSVCATQASLSSILSSRSRFAGCPWGQLAFQADPARFDSVIPLHRKGVTTMLYTAHNALGARVYEIEGAKEMRQVLSVDTDKAEVRCAADPVRLRPGSEELETITVKFAAIHPIKGGEPQPVLFHCYGRQPA